jgi:hypothetical protein
LSERAFALVPLNEIASRAFDPRSGKTVAKLLHSLPPEKDAHAVVKVPSDVWCACNLGIESGKKG